MFKLRKVIIQCDTIFEFLYVTSEMLLTKELVLRQRGIASTRELAYIWYRVRRKYGLNEFSSCNTDMESGKPKGKHD